MLKKLAMLLFCLVLSATAVAQGVDTRAPDTLIHEVSNQVLATLRANPAVKGSEVNRINALIDELIAPHSDFGRTTAISLGRHWNTASAAQKRDLEREFRSLLVLVYAGGLRGFGDQTVQFRPFRPGPDDDLAVVRTYVINRGQPIQVDYRLYKSANGWKIFDVNVAGLWLTEAYRSQFAPILNDGGVANLIKVLREKNASLAKAG